jgi:hypothetical protein
MTAEETKKCPMCAEVIMAAAVKCKHCGERLDLPPARPAAAHRPPLLNWSPEEIQACLKRSLGATVLAALLMATCVGLVRVAFLSALTDGAQEGSATTEAYAYLAKQMTLFGGWGMGAAVFAILIFIFQAVFPSAALLVRGDESFSGRARSTGALLVVSLPLEAIFRNGISLPLVASGVTAILALRIRSQLLRTLAAAAVGGAASVVLQRNRGGSSGFFYTGDFIHGYFGAFDFGFYRDVMTRQAFERFTMTSSVLLSVLVIVPFFVTTAILLQKAISSASLAPAPASATARR